MTQMCRTLAKVLPSGTFSDMVIWPNRLGLKDSRTFHLPHTKATVTPDQQQMHFATRQQRCASPCCSNTAANPGWDPHEGQVRQPTV